VCQAQRGTAGLGHKTRRAVAMRRVMARRVSRPNPWFGKNRQSLRCNPTITREPRPTSYVGYHGLASEAALHGYRSLFAQGVFARSRSFPLVATLQPFWTIPCLAITRSTASTTSATVIRFIQRKSIGHSLKKHGLHST
jgi:hypothetical protein